MPTYSAKTTKLTITDVCENKEDNQILAESEGTYDMVAELRNAAEAFITTQGYHLEDMDIQVTSLEEHKVKTFIHKNGEDRVEIRLDWTGAY